MYQNLLVSYISHKTFTMFSHRIYILAIVDWDQLGNGGLLLNNFYLSLLQIIQTTQHKTIQHIKQHLNTQQYSPCV